MGIGSFGGGFHACGHKNNWNLNPTGGGKPESILHRLKAG